MAKPDRYQRIAEQVCKDLGCEPESDLCRHVAMLRAVRENLLADALLHRRVSPADVLGIDEALKAYLPKREDPEIHVHVIRSLKAKCPHCGKMSEASTEPFPDSPNQTHPESDKELAARTAAPAPAKPAVPPLPTRRNVSLSAFHDQVRSDGGIAPLKHAMTSRVSPMSSPGSDPKPRREFAPAGSAFDEMNPDRRRDN